MPVDSFRGISSIKEKTFNEKLLDNVYQYINWSFLSAGAFYNIRIPTSGSYGGDRSKLIRMEDPRFLSGRVWEAYRGNWVWESGLPTQEQPINISGIFINNTFWPKNSGYYLDYINGRVVFDKPMPANSSVKLEYSHKWINIVNAESLDWKEIQARSFRVDQFSPSGVYNKLSESRLQLPAIAIERPFTRKSVGYELGGAKLNHSEVVFHIIGEDDSTTSKIGNILSEQKEQTLYFFDSQRLIEDDKLPLNYRNSPKDNAMTYPMLIAETGVGGYRYPDIVKNGKISIVDTENQGTTNINNTLSHNPLRWTIEAILPKI